MEVVNVSSGRLLTRLCHGPVSPSKALSCAQHCLNGSNRFSGGPRSHVSTDPAYVVPTAYDDGQQAGNGGEDGRKGRDRRIKEGKWAKSLLSLSEVETNEVVPCVLPPLGGTHAKCLFLG